MWVRMYWELGRDLDGYMIEHGKGYGEQVFRLVAVEHNLTPSLVYDALRFYRRVPNSHMCGNLSWSHFRLVLSVEDDEAREYYLDQAVLRSWSVRELAL